MGTKRQRTGRGKLAIEREGLKGMAGSTVYAWSKHEKLPVNRKLIFRFRKKKSSACPEEPSLKSASKRKDAEPRNTYLQSVWDADMTKQFFIHAPAPGIEKPHGDFPEKAPAPEFPGQKLFPPSAAVPHPDSAAR